MENKVIGSDGAVIVGKTAPPEIISNPELWVKEPVAVSESLSKLIDMMGDGLIFEWVSSFQGLLFSLFISSFLVVLAVRIVGGVVAFFCDLIGISRLERRVNFSVLFLLTFISLTLLMMLYMQGVYVAFVMQ